MIFDEIKQTTQDAIFYLDSLKSELNMLSMLYLSTNTISPGSRLLISSYQAWLWERMALRTHVESLGKPRDVNKHSQSLAW